MGVGVGTETRVGVRVPETFGVGVPWTRYPPGVVILRRLQPPCALACVPGLRARGGEGTLSARRAPLLYAYLPCARRLQL